MTIYLLIIIWNSNIQLSSLVHKTRDFVALMQIISMNSRGKGKHAETSKTCRMEMEQLNS